MQEPKTIRDFDPIWLAEFRGFFYGEGYLSIVSWGREKRLGCNKLTGRANITQRSDDAAILYDIRSKLGGFIYQERHPCKLQGANGKEYVSKPVHIWRLTKVADLRLLCDILEAGVLPARKKEQVVVMREFLKTVLPPGHRVPLEVYQRRMELANQMKALHHYSDS